MKAGQTAKWDIKVDGEPPPEVQWFKGKEPVQMSGTLSVNSKRGEFTVLQIHPTVRADGGQYALKLKVNHPLSFLYSSPFLLEQPWRVREHSNTDSARSSHASTRSFERARRLRESLPAQVATAG